MCPAESIPVVFEWPTQAVIDKMLASGVLQFLAGFEIDKQHGSRALENFILSNGDRSQLENWFVNQPITHMMPARSHKKIRSVTIHSYVEFNIIGLSFFDKEGALLWEIGNTTDPGFLGVKWDKTVLVAEDEVIVGVVARIIEEFPFFYFNF